MSLPKDTQEAFDKLRAIDNESLTDEQRAFLTARSEYLTDEEKERFEIGDDEPQQPAPDGYEKMKVDELLALVSERQLNAPEKPKKAELIEVLRAADAEESEPQQPAA